MASQAQTHGGIYAPTGATYDVTVADVRSL